MPPVQPLPLPVGRQQPGLLLPGRPNPGHNWDTERTAGELALHRGVRTAAPEECGQAQADAAHPVCHAQGAGEAHGAGEHQGGAHRPRRDKVRSWQLYVASTS